MNESIIVASTAPIVQQNIKAPSAYRNTLACVSAFSKPFGSMKQANIVNAATKTMITLQIVALFISINPKLSGLALCLASVGIMGESVPPVNTSK